VQDPFWYAENTPHVFDELKKISCKWAMRMMRKRPKASGSARITGTAVSPRLIRMNPSRKAKLVFARLMRYPEEWLRAGMLTDVLYKAQLARYRWGDERAAEHDRSGAFHWWLQRVRTRSQLKKLLELSYLDPDQWMAADIRRYIREHTSFDSRLSTFDKKRVNRFDKALKRSQST
jgi:hypothetical protein